MSRVRRARRVVRGCAAVTALTVLAGCGTARVADPHGPGTPSTAGVSSPAATGGPTGGPTTRPSGSMGDSTSHPSARPTLDPGHAMARPGPFRPPLLGADMLVFNQGPLSTAMVRRIRALPHVQAVDQFAMAQTVIENESLNVAAVDPSTYRSFNPIESARFQQEWDRIAGGEVAMAPGLEKHVPADGFLKFGTGADAPQVHVGVYAPQVSQVDAVVNEKWGATLGMAPGNALLVNTGTFSPQSVRRPIERIVGDKVSVQILGPDLDTSVQQTAFLVGTVADAVGTFNYTVLGGGHIAPDPSWVAAHIVTAEVPILGAVTCNRLMIPQMRAALQEIVDRGLADQIHPGEYAGCYYPRFIAGTTKLSNHSFGLAFDLNVPGNQRGTVGEMNRQVVAIFGSWGFTWGGTWHYTDPMHFEMNALVRPG